MECNNFHVQFYQHMKQNRKTYPFSISEHIAELKDEYPSSNFYL